MPNAPTAPTTAKRRKHVAFPRHGRSPHRIDSAARGSTSGAKRPAPAKPFRPRVSRMVFGYLVTEECMREYVRLHPEDVYLPKWASDPDKRASQIRSVKVTLERNIPQACRNHFPSLPQFREIRIGVTDGRRYGNAVILADTDSRDTAMPPPHVIEEVAKYIGQEGIEPEWFYVYVVA